ncbi:MAG TPA: STAS domain-containing protein [Terriglobales bacterium]|nr:STAS domain-containing protein [Terriglobales bacterium]
MEISVRNQGEVGVIRLKGGLRLGQPVDDFRTAVDRVFEDGAIYLVINITEMPMVDSSGIGLLVRSQVSAKKRGGSVKLVNPSAFTVQTLKITGVLNIFEVATDEQEAIQSFAG